MTSKSILITIASVGVIASATAVAGSDQAGATDTLRSIPVLHVVPNNSLRQHAAYGWQYFSDARAVHAVAISPSGEYFLSLGDGLRQITGPAGQESTTQRTHS